MNEMARLNTTTPFLATLPIGTGNDLSRVLGWGAGYTKDNLFDILYNIEHKAEPALLDRWCIDVTPETEPTMLPTAEYHTFKMFQVHGSIQLFVNFLKIELL